MKKVSVFVTKATLLVLILAPLLVKPARAEPAPDTVVLPRALAEAIIALLERDDAVRVHSALLACAASNGAHPPTPDGCPAVTAALKAQHDALAEARKAAAAPQAEPPK